MIDLSTLTIDDEAEIFYGEVINIKDVITFQGDSVATIKKSFVESVEDYLSLCKERGVKPDKPFSGKFNLRLSPELHQEAFIAAKIQHQSLNTWVVHAIEQAIDGRH